jgi:hypothetical protein
MEDENDTLCKSGGKITCAKCDGKIKLSTEEWDIKVNEPS